MIISPAWDITTSLIVSAAIEDIPWVGTRYAIADGEAFGPIILLSINHCLACKNDIFSYPGIMCFNRFIEITHSIDLSSAISLSLSPLLIWYLEYWPASLAFTLSIDFKPKEDICTNVPPGRLISTVSLFTADIIFVTNCLATGEADNGTLKLPVSSRVTWSIISESILDEIISLTNLSDIPCRSLKEYVPSSFFSACKSLRILLSPLSDKLSIASIANLTSCLPLTFLPFLPVVSWSTPLLEGMK